MKTLEQAYADFNFENMVQEHLVGSTENINAYTECCGRYLGQNRTALIWQGKNGNAQQWTFEQLAEASGQLAHYMTVLGLRAGDCIAGLLPRTPELLITILRFSIVFLKFFFAGIANSKRIHSLIDYLTEKYKLRSLINWFLPLHS